MTTVKTIETRCNHCHRKGMGKWHQAVNRALKAVTRRSCRYCLHFEDK